MAHEKVTFHDEQDVTTLLENDSWRMDVLKAAAELNLPDWWIGAGFLRNAIWDAMKGSVSPPTRDVDLVYYDPINVEHEIDWAYDEKMKADYPFAEWEIRNQARMHYVDGFDPFISTANGISHWVETATCVATKLEDGKLRYLFCHGTDDLFRLVARPIPEFTTKEKLPTFYKRIEKKRWKEKWPSLRVEAK